MILNLMMAGLILAASYQVPYMTESLLVVLSTYGLLYYLMLVGLSLSTYVVNRQAWQDSIYVNNDLIRAALVFVGVVFVYVSTPYQFLFWLMLPWIVISSIQTIFGWLVNIGILEIKDKNE